MVEFSSTDLLIIIFSVILGIPILITCFTMIRRMHELHMTRQKVEGELFVSNTGEIFSEFHISIPELADRDYILVKVTKINTKESEVNSNGNISTETYKT